MLLLMIEEEKIILISFFLILTYRKTEKLLVCILHITTSTLQLFTFV